MAWEAQRALADGTRKAGADLSALQFTFVKIDTDGDVVGCSAVTDRPYGVLQNNPAAGEVCEITVIGVTKIKAGAALANAGVAIGTDTSGRAVAKTLGTDITHYLAGQLLTAAGAANEIVTAVVDCANPARAV